MSKTIRNQRTDFDNTLDNKAATDDLKKTGNEINDTTFNTAHSAQHTNAHAIRELVNDLKQYVANHDYDRERVRKKIFELDGLANIYNVDQRQDNTL